MSKKGIIVALVVLAGLVGLYFVTGDTPGSRKVALSDGAEKFKAMQRGDVARVVVRKGEAKAEVARKGDGWVLPTSYGYPADGEKVGGFFDELEKAEAFTQIGWSAVSHRDFEVDDDRGVRVTFYDSKDTELASVVLGDRGQTQSLSVSKIYMRFGAEDGVYESGGAPRSRCGLSGDDLDVDHFLNKVLFEIPDENEIQSAELHSGADQTIILERRWQEKPKDATDAGDEADGKIVEKKDEEVEKEDVFWVSSGSEAFQADDKKWEVRSYLNKKSLRVDEAVDPAKGLAAMGLDNPQLKVVLKHRKKDDEAAKPASVTVLFGNEIKEEAEGKTAETKAYYVMLDNAERIYSVASYAFSNWQKKLKDFKKKEEEKEEEKPAEAEGGAAVPDGTAPSPDAAPATDDPATDDAPGSAAPAPEGAADAAESSESQKPVLPPKKEKE